MTAISAWTCPFCPLACDHLGVQVGPGDEPLALAGGRCERASRALATFTSAPAPARPTVDGRPASFDEALAAAAALLRASRQPLFAGLGADVAGARALYPLACATGAITDGAGGEAPWHGLRALQDRGQFTTTLAEVRERADLVVFIGDAPVALAPLLAERCGLADKAVVTLAGVGPGEPVRAEGDLFTQAAWLEAAVAGRLAGRVPAPIVALGERLRAARYAVLVGLPATLPAHGALVVETVHRIVGHLNARTRAAALWIGGADGSSTTNQVFAWLSGLPLRTRAGARGLEHEPLVFAAERVLAQGGADLLLWMSTFDAAARPPATTLPLVVIGHPAQGEACARAGAVFIPVATPGIGCAGDLFRTDGTVMLPLHPVRAEVLPAPAEVVARLRRVYEENA